MWRIAGTGAACAVAGICLLWASLYVFGISPSASQPADPTPPGPGSPRNPDPTYGLANVLLLLSMMAWAGLLICAGWLAYRGYMKIPAWRRRKWFGKSW